MTSPWLVAAWCVLAYLVGGLPTGWLLVQWRRYGLDLRKFGTGNIGTSNVYRHAGIDIAVVVGPLQFAQGFVPVLVARVTGVPLHYAVLVGLAAVVGNGWPFYLRFNGGRGVAVATGVVAALSLAGLITLLVCFGAGALRRRIALGVLVGFVLLPLAAFVFGGKDAWWLGAGCAGILVLLLLRRLEGLVRDTRVYGHFWRRVYRRVVFDDRPGRPLMGPRTDPGAGPLRHQGSGPQSS